MKVLMIQRAEQFSPNSVEKDQAILEAVAVRLRQKGHEVETVSETLLKAVTADAVFTMGRQPQTLDLLRASRAQTVNTPDGVAHCARTHLESVMRTLGIPQAPAEGADGYWLKRGDMAAQSRDDVQYASTREALEAKIAGFRSRGISQYVVSAHVKGDLVKFYGVTTGFFRYYYPTDDGHSKFGDERRNGEAQHYAFDSARLQTCAERLAAAIGIQVYGGDCIVREDGTFCMIDFNDWPSFSRCREEAAEAIASLIR